MTAQDTSSFFSGGSPSVKFEHIGDSITGQLLAKELRQQTNPDTGERLTWQDGRPKMVAVLTLQMPGPDDPEDDGIRTLYVRGLMQRRFQEALKALKLRDLPLGIWVRVTWTSEDSPSAPDRSGTRDYEVRLKMGGSKPYSQETSGGRAESQQAPAAAQADGPPF